MADQFWLYEWIDEQGITSLRSAGHALKSKKAFTRLQELASRQTYTLEPLPKEAANVIVAGRAIDLSGELDCSHWECLKKKVDNLFGRVWHYFDEIVVEGLSAHSASRMIEQGHEDALRHIESHIRNLLYIRSIGAEQLLIFRQKPPACVLHYRDHLEEVGLKALLDNALWVIDLLERDGQLDEMRRHDDHWHYIYNHPMLEHTQWGSFFSEEDSPNPLTDPQRAVAVAVFKEYSAHLVSDARTARYLSAPLAASVSLHGEVLDRATPETTVGQVALDLALPVLEGVPARELIKIREEEALSFERFRTSLRSAIKERLKNVHGGASVSVASEIVEDIIEPTLNDIEHRLGVAQSVLAKKSLISIGVGAASATIGLIAGMPLLLPAGIAWALLPGQHYLKYLEEKATIQLSDMYFLWRQERLGLSRDQQS